jgi:hypothetical protein
MILCCGVVFYAFQLYPREGFLLWVLGMVLVVSSPELSRLLRRDLALPTVGKVVWPQC